MFMDFADEISVAVLIPPPLFLFYLFWNVIDINSNSESTYKHYRIL